jgi:hypothetical protein
LEIPYPVNVSAVDVVIAIGALYVAAEVLLTKGASHRRSDAHCWNLDLFVASNLNDRSTIPKSGLRVLSSLVLKMILFYGCSRVSNKTDVAAL